MNNKDKQRITGAEGVVTLEDGNKKLLAIFRRDPITGEHLVYKVQKATSEEIAEFFAPLPPQGEAVEIDSN